MGEDELDLLYEMTPISSSTKKFLLMEQDYRCADCGTKLEEKILSTPCPPKDVKVQGI